MSARIKWFNPAKGFGFVTPDDGSPEAFLPASALERAGHETAPVGAKIVVDLSQGQKGPQVVTVHSVEAPVAGTRPRRGQMHAPQPAPKRENPATSSHGKEVQGTVRFFDTGKGFGFIIPDNGGKDIYVHTSALRRSGLEFLQPQVRVKVTVKRGEKGIEAERVEFL